MTNDELVESVRALVLEHSPSTVLRAFQTACKAEFDRMSSESWDLSMASRQNPGYYETPKYRRRRDEESAWLCVSDTSYLANDFEKRMSMAGMSEDERDAIHRQEKRAKLERELERLSK